jgi:hypothetical protein
MMVQKEGVYRGRPIVTAIEEKDTGSVQFNGTFQVTEIKEADGWKPVEGDQQINAYLNLITKAGAPNEINIRSLKDSLGWDGASFASLQKQDWNGAKCQLVVGQETYDGKAQMKVKYVNPYDYEGGAGVAPSEPQVIQSLDAKYGGMLRALGGKATATPAPVQSPSMGKDLAWQLFVRRVDEYGAESPSEAYTHDKRVSVFKQIVTEIAGAGKDLNKLSAAEWANVHKQIEKNFSAQTAGLLPF